MGDCVFVGRMIVAKQKHTTEVVLFISFLNMCSEPSS